MSGYVVANLLGRLLASYSIVWIVNLIAAKGKGRLAFKRTNSIGGLLAVGFLLFVGLAKVMA